MQKKINPNTHNCQKDKTDGWWMRKDVCSASIHLSFIFTRSTSNIYMNHFPGRWLVIEIEGQLLENESNNMSKGSLQKAGIE